MSWLIVAALLPATRAAFCGSSTVPFSLEVGAPRSLLSTVSCPRCCLAEELCLVVPGRRVSAGTRLLVTTRRMTLPSSSESSSSPPAEPFQSSQLSRRLRPEPGPSPTGAFQSPDASDCGRSRTRFAPCFRDKRDDNPPDRWLTVELKKCRGPPG